MAIYDLDEHGNWRKGKRVWNVLFKPYEDDPGFGIATCRGLRKYANNHPEVRIGRIRRRFAQSLFNAICRWIIMGPNKLEIGDKIMLEGFVFVAKLDVDENGSEIIRLTWNSEPN